MQADLSTRHLLLTEAWLDDLCETLESCSKMEGALSLDERCRGRNLGIAPGEEVVSGTCSEPATLRRGMRAE